MNSKKSVKPNVNRQRRIKAPTHRRRKEVSVVLNSDLREKYPGVKRLPIRREDTVEVIKGQFIGIKKRVTKVRLDKMMIEIENVRSQKTDGTEIFHPISPCNCKLVALGKIDEGRRKIIDRRTTKTGGE